MPSVHEGYCLPVIEAMACGLPVLAARAAALPETVGSRPPPFTPDDPDDLARQVRRIFAGARTDNAVGPGKIAVVCFRFGPDVIGGAETSLRKIAHALKRQGRHVEVFTTCTCAESDWTNELAAGAAEDDGLLVHRFPIDPHDRRRHHEAIRRIAHAGGKVEPDLEAEYLRHSIHSAQLLSELGRRIGEFDAVVTGPYLFGLTFDVARRSPRRRSSCLASTRSPWPGCGPGPWSMARWAGFFITVPRSGKLAQAELGINHPRAAETGTFLPVGNPAREGGRSAPLSPVLGGEGLGVRGQALRKRTASSECREEGRPAGLSGRRYLVYCGRYSRQKDLPRLLEYAARYQALRPGRFDFVFLGRGEVAIPQVEGFHDLGPVNEATNAPCSPMPLPWCNCRCRNRCR